MGGGWWSGGLLPKIKGGWVTRVETCFERMEHASSMFSLFAVRYCGCWVDEEC